MRDTFTERYKKLNTDQKKATDTVEGPVLVIAGPGSGKTELLSMRVANILKTTDTDPQNILCLTFTEAAAVNMRKRLESLIGPEAFRVAIYTFHTFGVRIIERYPEFFYGGAVLASADELVQIEVLDTIFENLNPENPLRSVHPELGYVYLNDVLSSIGEMKKAGLSPGEFHAILENNKKLIGKLSNLALTLGETRVSKKSVDLFIEAHKEIESLKEETNEYFENLAIPLSTTLGRALEGVEEEDSTKALSQWKRNNIVKTEKGYVWKEETKLEKLESLAHLYDLYIKEMYSQGYYDFDDMILQSIQAIEQNETLQYELQEEFQYVLVDEFQDTNDAQMRLLLSIVNSEVNDGRPNIMVVGDDDQAIYRFQGAQVGHIINFTKFFREPAIITLTKNYRSEKKIVDLALQTIRQGEERIEKILPGIDKTLVSASVSEGAGQATYTTFPSVAHEYSFVARRIKKLLDKGHPAEEIAVIGRTHKSLERVVSFLHEEKIPVRYERQLNVLKEAHIQQIIQITRLLEAIGQGDEKTADSFLPEVLSYPFWNIDRLVLWKMSVQAFRERISWLELAQNSKDKHLTQIADFFIHLSARARFEPLEHILDEIIGSHVSLIAEEENEDEETRSTASDTQGKEIKMFSPFREYYFSKERFSENKAQYLSFLSSLRVFIEALRQYRQGEVLTIKDLIQFVDIHEKNKKLVADTSPFINADSAVHVLTAHKAKGLEYESVFVINCVQNIWAPRSRGNKIPFPANIPIRAEADSTDDKLRLFFVALSRAKRNLYLTGFEFDDEGHEVLPLQFISGLTIEKETVEIPDVHDVLTAALNSYHQLPATSEQEKLLQSLVENYQMSVTHLNNFLDVRGGGPQTFLEQNLLRFPQAKTASGSFGSVMHKTIEWMYMRVRQEGLPDFLSVEEYFKEMLIRERLREADQRTFEARGLKALEAFYKEKASRLNPADRIEANFKNQGVFVGGAHLSGKIDRMSFDGSQAHVYDFKTGSSAKDWKGTTLYEKIKLHKYKRQLIFYKILVENSREFSGKYTVEEGTLQFLEPLSNSLIELGYQIEKDEVERLKKLIEIVYQKITTLDFPDISHYPETLEGTIQFEDYLLDSD